MSTDLTLEQFIINKRTALGLTARELADELDVSAVFICHMEKGRKQPSKELLDRMAVVLKLSTYDKALLYDLAAEAKQSISMDLPDYIMDNNIVKAALRTAKEHDATDQEWQEFIKRIEQRAKDKE